MRRWLLGTILLSALAAPCAAQQFPSKPITLVVPYARRRQRRHQRPRAAGRHRRRARPADHHREPPRRRRHDRRRLCRALGAGRPHAVRRLERADPARPDDHAEAALPMGQGVRAGQHARGRHQHAAGDAEAAGEDRGRADRLRQEKSRQAHRSPRPAAPASITSWASCSSFKHRHHLDRGALSRQRAGDQRPDRRPRRYRPACSSPIRASTSKAGGSARWRCWDPRARPRCPRCRPSSRRACPTCRASPSTACSRRRARRRRWSRSSARRSAWRWRRKTVADKLGELGSDARGSTPEEFTKFLEQETAKWTDVMQKANIKVQE